MAALTRITINLRDKAANDLNFATATTGENSTEVIHTAIALYALYLRDRESGAEFLRRTPGKTELESIIIL